MKYSQWERYVPVAERKQKAAKHVAASKKKGITLNPVMIEGRAISKTFWGKAWCENLEFYSDYANRLPRGRTYVRNGSVIDLKITKGQVKAQVMGSSLYQISIDVKEMPDSKWKTLIAACAGKIDSLIELLQGKFSKAVMEVITQKEKGLFPKPQEISMKCSCPDSAYMCKHIAAVLYGIGAALDIKPEWIFELRHVQHLDLLASASQGSSLVQHKPGAQTLTDSDLSALFDIEMDAQATKGKKINKPKPTPKPKAKAKANVKVKIKAPTVKAKTPIVKAKKKPKPIKRRRSADNDTVIIRIVD